MLSKSFLPEIPLLGDLSHCPLTLPLCLEDTSPLQVLKMILQSRILDYCRGHLSHPAKFY